VNWVLDADIRSFFDTLDRRWLVEFIEHRASDRQYGDSATDDQTAQGEAEGGVNRSAATPP
jgi:retron-type reverse transcriptase